MVKINLFKKLEIPLKPGPQAFWSVTSLKGTKASFLPNLALQTSPQPRAMSIGTDRDLD